MKAATPIRSRRNPRMFVAALLAYLMLAGQVAPLALAAAPRATVPTPVKAETQAPAAPGGEAARAVPVPAPLTPITAQVTATMAGAITTDADSDGKADPGVDTITYTATVTNNSGGDLSGLQFTDTVDSHTTLVAGSAAAAADDRYSTIGNVNINVAAPGVLSNDFDPDTGNNTGMTVVSYGASTGAEQTSVGTSTPTAQGGTVTVNSNGSFTFDPKTGSTGTDTFKYVSSSGGKTATATVTITITGRIWFVNSNTNACSSNCDGRLSHPFTTLGAFQSVNGDAASGHPQDGDTVFLYESPNAYAGPVTLRTNQKFIGQDATATIETLTGLSTPSGSTVLPVMNAGNATVVNIQSSSNAINLGTGVSNANLLRGFSVTSTTGAKIFGSNFGTLTVGNSLSPDVSLSGAGQALNLSTGAFAATSGFLGVGSSSSSGTGVSLTGITGAVSFGSTSISSPATQGISVGTTTADISFGNTTVSGGTDGVSFQNNATTAGHGFTFGTLGVSGGSGSAFLHGAGGGNVTVSGTATLSSAASAVSVSSPSSTNIINFQAATSATSTGSGNAGVNWAGTAGAQLTFNSLSIQTNAGTGLNASGGGTINVTNATGTVNNTAQAAPAIVAGSVTLNAKFSSIKSTNSGTTGVSLTGVGGTSDFGGGAISGSTGDAFFVSGGTISVTYAGTIASGSAHSVNISSMTGGGVTFTGAITDTDTGITLASNNGATINFNGGLSLSTGANDAFTATGVNPGTGGTVNVTQNNSTIVNTITTTSGAALKFKNTLIGASGLTFRSISAGTSSGTAGVGISLDTTGTAGGLTVTGNSSGQCGGSVTGTVPNLTVTAFNSADCTGGEIQHKTGNDGDTANGIGIYLNNTGAVSLTRVWLHDFNNYGIYGSGVPGLTISNSLFNGSNGTNQNGSGEGAVYFFGLGGASSGTASVTNSSFSGGALDTFHLENNGAQVLNRITFTGDNFGDTLNATSASALFMQADCTAQLKMTIDTSVFTAARSNNANISIRGQSNDDLIVSNSKFSNSDGSQVSGGSNLAVAAGGPSSVCSDNTLNPTLTFNIHNNTFKDALGTAISISKGGTGAGKFGTAASPGIIDSNTIGVSGNSTSSGAGGIGAILVGGGQIVTNITNNTVHGAVNGISIGANSSVAGGGQGYYQAVVQGNTVDTPNVGAGNVTNGLLAQFGSVSTDNPKVCLTLGGSGAQKNILTGSGQNGGADLRLRVRFATIIGVVGYAGANNDDSAMASFLNSQNTASIITVTNNATTGSGWTGTCPSGVASLHLSAPDAPASAETAQNAGAESAAALTASAAVEGGSLSATGAPAQATDTASTSAREWSDIPASRAASDARQVNASYADDTSREGVRFVNASYEPAGDAQASHASRRVKASAATAAAPVITSCSPSGINNAGTAICVDIPTLHNGDSIQITFQVTVNNLPNLSQTNPAQVSNHGTVTGPFTGTPLDTNTVNTPVDRFHSTTTLGSNNNPSSQGDNVTFTATVAFDTAEVSPTPATPTTPTGTVDFIDTSNGNAAVCTGVSLSGGTAQCQTSSLSASTHNIQAVYNGDGNYNGSTSNTVAQVVIACTATQTVTSTADDGSAGTFRYAVAHLCTNGTVNFQIPESDGGFDSTNHIYTITLTGGEVPVSRNMTIVGPNSGADTDPIRISGGDASRVIDVAPSIAVQVSNLTFTHGSATSGGAVVNGNGSTLVLTNVTVSNSSATGNGGGILNGSGSTLTLEGCTVSGNTASGTNSLGGGIMTVTASTVYVDNTTVDGNHASGANGQGGGIYAGSGNADTVYVSNSTISNNTAGDSGGGLAGLATLVNNTVSGNSANGQAGGIFAMGDMEMVNTTVTNNRADADGDNNGAGGGLYINSGTVTLKNTVVAGNFKGTGSTPDDIGGEPGTSATGNNNLIGTGGSGGLTDGTNGNQVGVADAKLGALANNGGPTKTHALLSGSPAIDAGADVTTLNGSVDNATTSVTLTDATAIPAAVGFLIQVGSEQMTVTAKSGNTLTVVRGANSTTAAQHNDGAGVNPAFDQRRTPFHRKTAGKANDTPTVDIGSFEVQPPAANDDSYSTNEDTPLSVNAAGGVLANDTGTGTKTAAVATGPSHASSFTLNSDGSFDYTPASNFNGQDSFTYTVSDSGGGSAQATATITVNSVNDPPTTSNNAVAVLEDHTYTFQTSDFPFADTADNPPNTLANVIVTSAPANGTLADNGTQITAGNVPFAVSAADLAGGKLTFAPAANGNGAGYASFNFEVQDNGGGSDTSAAATMTINVTAVNDPPSFTKGSDVTVLEDAGAQTVTGWATNISAGPSDESGQTVTFQVTGITYSNTTVYTTDATFFTATPVVDGTTGTLSFQAAPNANGTATVTVVAKDNGGTANGGSDTSAPQTFKINVTAVNDAPSFTKGTDQTVDEDAGAQTVNNWATNISAGPSDESGQTLTFNVTSNTNTALFSVQPAVSSSTGTLTYTPAANAFGSATITLTLSDNGGTANGGSDTSAPQTFKITVNPVADTPSVTNSSTLEDTQSTTGLVISRNAADGSEVTNFKITNIQHGTLFKNDGTTQINPGDFITFAEGNAGLKFTPATDFNSSMGTASFDVQASTSNTDAGLGGGTATATISVTAVNDAPVFTKGPDQSVPINSSAQTVNNWATNIAPGPATATDESGQTLNFIVTNDNNTLFSAQPAVSTAGTLSYTPAPNKFGQATVSVSLHDNGGTANGGSDTSAVQTFTITVGMPSLTAHDAQAAEPASGTSKMIFTVTMSPALASQTVTVGYATADDSGGSHPATSGTCGSPGVDYEPASGTLTFGPGDTIKTVEVTICSDGDSGSNAASETLKLNLSNPSGANVSGAQATGTITHTNAPGTFIISEIRTSGPGGAGDQFVELYNNTDSSLKVQASDASGGYGVFKMGATCTDAPVLVAQIPDGTVIPARGHYLLVGSQYSLKDYGGTDAAKGNQMLTSDIESDRNVAVFTTSDANNLSTVTRLDAVGFGSNVDAAPVTSDSVAPGKRPQAAISTDTPAPSGGICDLFREGTNLPAASGSTLEYSFFRKDCDLPANCTGTPKDTNDNAADFLFADTQGTSTPMGQRLGAPGPENLSSPVDRDSTIANNRLDSSQAAAASVNRFRDPTSNTPNAAVAPFGTISLRRRVTNTTGGDVTLLRFRVIEVTTFPNAAGNADLRAITSSDTSVSNVHDMTTCVDRTAGSNSNCTVLVKGTLLEQPPTQTSKGGGYNSTWSVNLSGLPGGKLANGQSVEVQMQLGVVQPGNFRILVIVEALP